MGSTRPPCPKCGGFLVRDYDPLDVGDTVSIIKCCNCGWRLLPRPKCFIDDDKPQRDAKPGGMKHDRKVSGHADICPGCGLYRVIRSGGMCGLCVKRDRAERKANALSEVRGR